MPEGHNRILLGLDTEGGIKENQGRLREGDREKEREFFTHTTSFLIWWFCDLT